MTEETARRYGEAGRPVAEAITWDAAIARLLGSAALQPVEDAERRAVEDRQPVARPEQQRERDRGEHGERHEHPAVRDEHRDRRQRR